MTIFFKLLPVAVVVALSGNALAGELSFPMTQSEFAKALSFKDGDFKHQDQTFKINGGRIYKIIKGKRYRVRGLGGIEAIEETSFVPRVAALVTFTLNSADIHPESFPVLDELAKAMNSDLGQAKLVVAGHTDSSGNDAYNVSLSKRRAQAVQTYLSNRHGISKNRLLTKAYGESRPLASNSTEDGRNLNRRVEFIRIE